MSEVVFDERYVPDRVKMNPKAVVKDYNGEYMTDEAHLFSIMRRSNHED